MTPALSMNWTQREEKAFHTVRQFQPDDAPPKIPKTIARPGSVAAQVEYYDLKANWPKVRRHINRPEVQRVPVEDFNKFTWGRWGEEFRPGMKPGDFESCDWQYDWQWSHPGQRRPAYWKYTKHSACHWLANFSLVLAMRVEPDRPWRILTSRNHSTVWDGERTLFDFNFSAMGIKSSEAYRMARWKGRMLTPGQVMKVYFAKDCHDRDTELDAWKDYEQHHQMEGGR